MTTALVALSLALFIIGGCSRPRLTRGRHRASSWAPSTGRQFLEKVTRYQ